MQLIRPFNEIGKGDAGLAGGKGASLGEMTQAGIPVPLGYVVLADAFEKFLDEANLNQELDAIFHTVNHEEMRSVDLASERIQRLIVEAKMPEDIAAEILQNFEKLGATYVAVRSSATAEDSSSAAWAGQLDTFLNTTEDNVLTNVQKCWASLFTPRAIFYRFEKGMHGSKISVAVVVQKMIQSEVSGIAFSVHPVTEDYNQLIIEAGYGLGEAIVSGQVTPDSFVVEKEPRRIIDKNISYQSKALWRAKEGGNEWRDLSESEGNKPSLSDEQVMELSNIVLNIEKHYGFPCDIEWAYEAGTFYITQSRPITTLSPKVEGDPAPQHSGEGIVELIKNADWHQDWNGPFPLLDITIGNEAYQTTLPTQFGKSITLLVTFKDGIASAWLSTKEYEELGTHLVKNFSGEEAVLQWSEAFKKKADEVYAIIRSGPQNLVDQIDLFAKLYREYAAYQVATKTTFNFLPLNAVPKIKETLEAGRRYSESLYMESVELFTKVAESVVEKNPSYTADQILMMTIGELRTYLSFNTLPPAEILQQRYECSAVYWDSEGLHLLSGEQTKTIENAWIGEFDGKILKGVVAYKGKVTGKCRVIINYKNARLEEGEVLVTGMTDPHFVPLMQKASAIVTDGGGLLSHAAIVSRELQKPCVIGTKFATQVFKDGDIVEVDADNGMVRKI